MSAYVWQRQPGPEVAAAMAQFAPQLQEICVLAAEISWTNRGSTTVRVPLNFAALARVGCPVGLAVRIGSYPRMPASNDPELRQIQALVTELLARARAEGLEPTEIQIDFDCAESKLAGYRCWLEDLRKSLGGTKLVFTVLPSWLKRAEFIPLARAADGFVLQVHSLQKPARIDQIPTLCDPLRARAWIVQAEKAGVDFRVALPTHGYLLGFDRFGNYLGLGAEGPLPNWPFGTQIRTVRSDPVAMTTLMRDILATPTPHLRGIIWFRLPVGGDRLAWNAVTFAAVLRGETPQAHLTAEAVWVEPGLVEISLINDGQTTELLPGFVQLRGLKSEKMQSGDGLGGFQLEMRGSEVQGISRATGVVTDATIAPGRRMKIAWLRFAHDLPLEALVVPPP
ncbi:MAG: DUF3142 domain-containing protein [Opitutaceae bacterium]